MRRSTIAVTAATLVLCGCGGGSESLNTRSGTTTSSTAAAAVRAKTVGPGATQRLRCADFINTSPPPRDYSVVLNVVGLPTSPHSEALQTARTHDVPAEPRLFAKTGLLIRADSKFSLLVPDRERLGSDGRTDRRSHTRQSLSADARGRRRPVLTGSPTLAGSGCRQWVVTR